jgi:DNA-directed RNA polymerase specialized sigma24 family protein
MQRPLFDDEFSDLARLAYRVALRILGDRSTAEDVAQESLARAYMRWTKISEYRQAWVARVSGNLAIDQLRRMRPSTVAARQVDAEVMLIERIDLQRALLDARSPPARQQ